MGTITRSFANNLTTNGILKAGAFNNASLNNVTALNVAIATGNMVLISSQTASASASISFTTGIDSTFKEYQFYFINIHPATDGTLFQFQGSTNGGSSYGVTLTTTAFQAYHIETDNDNGLGYGSNRDLAQSTSFQPLFDLTGNQNDESGCAILTLFNPSSITYVKHFTARSMTYTHADYAIDQFIGGYFNTTSAIDAIQFKFASGNIDDGTILMFGIK